MKQDAIWTRDFLGISFSNFFIFMTFYMLIATLPMFVLNQLGGNNAQIGLVLTVFVLASVLARPFVGSLMERVGKKRLLFLSLGLFFVFSLLYFVVDTYWMLLLLRFVHGLSFGVATSCTGTVAADVVPEKRIGEGLGYYGMFMSLAMVVGPFLGLTVIQLLPFSSVFVICSVCCLLCVVSALLVNVQELAKAEKRSERQPFRLSSFLESKAVPVALSGFVLALVYSGISAFIPVYGKELGLLQITNFFFAVYAIMVILPRPINGRLFDRVGENSVIYPGILFFIIGMVLLSQAHSAVSFLGSAAVTGLGYGALFPSFQALCVRSAPAHRRGFATSTFLFFYDAGMGLGSMGNGMLAGQFGYHSTYLIGAGVMVITIWLYFFLHHKKQPNKRNKAAATSA